MSHQLSLNLRLKDGSSFSNYYPGRNQEAFERIRTSVVDSAHRKKSSHQSIFLWGAEGTGKTHLLQAACRLAQELGINPLYVPLTDVINLSPALLDDAEQTPLICLDDVERAAGRSEWEAALFSLLEQLRSVGGLLINSAVAPPSNLGLSLPDLTSRMAWGTVYALQVLGDSEKLEAIRLRAHNRGFDLTEEVTRYILSRYPRDMHSLFDLLERIDRASLIHQRRVTIPFLQRLEKNDIEDTGFV